MEPLPAICTEPAALEAFRALLGFGAIGAGVMFCALMVHDIRQLVKKPLPHEVCPLHKIASNRCAPYHRDDRPSEGPADSDFEANGAEGDSSRSPEDE